MFREARYREAQRLFSSGQDIERSVAGYLADKPGDYFGAFRRVPILPRRLFLQSYQAYLYNLTVSRSVATGMDISKAEKGDNWTELAQDGLRIGKIHGVREPQPEAALPLVQLVGYAFRDYGSRFDRLIVPILKEEGMTPSQFYIKEAEEVSNEGGFRQAPLLATGLAKERVEGGIALEF